VVRGAIFLRDTEAEWRDVPRTDYGGQKARAISAGTDPAAAVYTEVVEVMREVGIDLSRAMPRLLTSELAENASLLVTMGCGERCPVVPGLAREDWPLQDPKGQSIALVRAIREKIRERVVGLIDRNGWAREVGTREPGPGSTIR
jgi:arsenate reductase (thioredoxin)